MFGPPARLSPTFLADPPRAAGLVLQARRTDRLEPEISTPALWPWRFAAMAGLAHLVLALVVLLAVRVHMPAPPPEPISIEVVSETIPKAASAVQPAPQPLPAPPPPMPSPPLPPAPSSPMAAPPPPAPQNQETPKPAAQSAGFSRIKAQKMANVTVAVTHPAVPFADNQAPDYPQAAIAAGEQGVVRFRLYLSAGGWVRNFQLIQSSGYADLDANVRRAAMGWRYRPATRNGVDVPSVVQFFVQFEPH